MYAINAIKETLSKTVRCEITTEILTVVTWNISPMISQFEKTTTGNNNVLDNYTNKLALNWEIPSTMSIRSMKLTLGHKQEHPD